MSEKCGDVYDPDDEFVVKCTLPAGHDADRENKSEPIVHSDAKGSYWYSVVELEVEP